jgi:predicted aconitase with swiveling domain
MTATSPVRGVVLVPGLASGATLVLDEPLSFWGGVDPASGVITDAHHPQVGAVMSGRIMLMPAGRGSSSSSSVLAEAIRGGVGPAAILLGTSDPIIALGALVGAELYGVHTPVVVLDAADYATCCAADALTVDATDAQAVVSSVGAPP